MSTVGYGYPVPVTQTKLCNVCQQEKPLKDMEVRCFVNGGPHYRPRCLQCKRDWYRSLKENHPERIQRYRDRWSAKERTWRSKPENLPDVVLEDSRKTDRKAGRSNDLTREFVAQQLARGCSYCGETSLRMTLDRRDNGLGHLQANVIPACIRCNFTRKNMPFEAWVIVAVGMREARIQGKFGDWTGRAR